MKLKYLQSLVVTFATFGIITQTFAQSKKEIENIQGNYNSYEINKLKEPSLSLSIEPKDNDIPFGCNLPNNIKIDMITASSAVVTWTKNIDDYFVVKYRNISHPEMPEIILTDIREEKVTLIGLYSSSTYEIEVGINCGPAGNHFNEAKQFKTLKKTVTYCLPKKNKSNGAWIKEVAFGKIRNKSGNNLGYKLFNKLQIDMIQGESFPVVLKATMKKELKRPLIRSSKILSFKIWVDFDQDGLFSEEEKILDKATDEYTPVSENILIPSDVKIGETRARIAMNIGGGIKSCESYTHGEVEDYTILVSSPIEDMMTLAYEPVQEVKNLEVTIYPNPVTNNILKTDWISTAPLKTSYRVINSIGKELISGKAKNEIDISMLNSGIYIFEIEKGTDKIAKKFIKE